MPYHVEDDHPDCSGWAVVKDDTGEVVPGGCHGTQGEADDHLTALNLAEFGDSSDGGPMTVLEQPPTRAKDDQLRLVEFRATKSADGLTLDGYAAVFDQWTDIEDHLGTYRERIAPGAFRRTIGMRMPVLQFDHGSHPLIGSIPLGRITGITEDAHGLRVKAKLSDNWLVQPVRDAIRDGGITGMSFRFRIVDEEWVKSRSDLVDERTIREVELFEVGPVVWPAYAQTSVGVRSRQALDALQDPEVRSEIARILAHGTDLVSLAEPDSSVDDHLSGPEAPVLPSHASVRTKTQRRAIARQYL